jgi:cyclic dehypoxanthinyl futalosine synthase
VLDYETLDRKIQETLDRGGTQLLLQGGLHPDLGLDYYLDLFRHIKERFDIHLHALSPPEIVHIARSSDLTLRETISRLRDVGLATIPGGGAEVLSDSVRSRVSPGKCTSDEWASVMETAHELGISTTATMMFGHGDTVEERVEHLTRIRDLQDRTHGFTAFIPWTYQPGNTKLGGVSPGGFEYLRTLAVSRIYLDNFSNIQASWVTQGKAVGTIALKFGANDMGGTMMEENVVAAAGCRNSMDEQGMRRLISEMGYRPVKRNTLYQHLEHAAVEKPD